MNNDQARAEPLAAQAAGARHVDPSPWFCSQVCTTVMGTMNVCVRGGHLSGTYAAYLDGALESALRPLVEAP